MKEDYKIIDEYLEEGMIKAKEIASKNMKEIKDIIGLL